MIRLMKRLRIALAVAATAVLLSPQTWPSRTDREPRLPSGRSQREAILEMEHKKSLEDAEQLLELAEELKTELEKNDRHVLSVSSLRKTEEIEKLAKRIRKRLKK